MKDGSYRVFIEIEDGIPRIDFMDRMIEHQHMLSFDRDEYIVYGKIDDLTWASHNKEEMSKLLNISVK